MKISLPTLAISLAFTSCALGMPASVDSGTLELSPANPLKTIELQQRHELEKRQAQLIPMAIGVWLAIAGESAAKPIIAGIAKALKTVFKDDPAPWNPGKDKCVIKFSTHAGAECKATIDAKGTISERPNNNWNVCPWIDPEHTDPPIQYFTDNGIGHYSIQFTATNKVAWKGIQGTYKCIGEGICHPRIIFYRKDHSIVLDTWASLGDPTGGQYSGEFGGLCGNGPVKNQFRRNGLEMGYDCGIPCDGVTNLPSTHKS